VEFQKFLPTFDCHPYTNQKPPTVGRIITILGDTCNSAGIAESARDSDILVHETTYDCSLTEQALRGAHSTTYMAADFAKEISAKKLVITHFSARYEDGSDITVGHLLQETQSRCPEIEVVAAQDLLEIDVPKKKKIK